MGPINSLWERGGVGSEGMGNRSESRSELLGELLRVVFRAIEHGKDM